MSFYSRILYAKVFDCRVSQTGIENRKISIFARKRKSPKVQKHPAAARQPKHGKNVRMQSRECREVFDSTDSTSVFIHSGGVAARQHHHTHQATKQTHQADAMILHSTFN
jgi:hypothetical protein